MNFSFCFKNISFAKAGSIGYFSVNGKQILTIVGKTYRLNVFGREFTNKDLVK